MTSIVKPVPPSKPFRWGYILAEMALIVFFSYIIFFATPHSGLFTPVVLGITAALFTGMALFYLLAGSAPDWRLALPALAVIMVLIISSLTSIDPRRSIAETWLIAMPFFLFFVLLELGRRGLPGELVVKALLVPGGLLMVMSWAQAFLWYRAWLADFPGQWLPALSYRLPAPNFLAMMFNLLLMLALSRLVNSRGTLNRLLLGLYVLSALGLLYLTSSRGGWIGTAAGLATLGLLLLRFQRARLLPIWQRLRPVLRNKVLLTATFLLGAIFITGLGGMLLRQAIHPTHAPALDSRGYLWQPAIRAFLEMPLLGRGPHTYASFFMRVHSVPPAALLDYAHNIYLDVLASSGLLGLAAFAWLLYILLRSLWQRFTELDDLQSAVVTGASACMAAFLVHGLFDSVHHSAPTGLWTLAIILAAALIQPGPCAPASVRLRIGFFMLPLFIVAFSWLNFWRVQPQFAGVRAANQGDYHTAAALLKEATRRDPNLAVIHSQLALVYNRLGDLDRSIPAMQRSLELDPDWAPNHANLGLLYWKKGDLERAGRAFNEASVRAPGFYLYPYWFASVAEESNHPLDARIAYTHALELYPELPDRPVWKATPLQLEALSAWQAAHPVGTSITIAQLEALVAANPASMHLLLKLTDRYLQDGWLDEAEALLKKGHRLVTVTIEHYDLRQREAYLAAARGDTATAESILAEIRSAKGEIGAFGPGTGPSSYVPFVFRRAGLQFEVVE